MRWAIRLYADSVATAKSLLETSGSRLALPVDAVVADRFAADAKHMVVPVDKVQPGWRILDIGPKTVALYASHIAGAKTVVWNGPMGVFEMDALAVGTFEVAKAVAGSGATSIIGGGDSAAAVEKAGLADQITHISTGGVPARVPRRQGASRSGRPQRQVTDGP